MKKSFLNVPVILLFFFMSCKDGPTTVSTNEAASQSETNKEHSKAVFKGVETGDLSVMDSFVAQDVVGHGPDIKGLDNVKKMLGDIHNHVSNLKMDLIASATDGDYEFALLRMTGTTKDTAMGMPPNTPIDEMSVGVAKIVNGKTTEHWNYVDPKDMMKAMKK